MRAWWTDIDPSTVVQKGRVQPGKMLLVDVVEGRIVSDDEIKHEVATKRPYRAWVEENKIDLAHLPDAKSTYAIPPEDLRRLQQVFGYTEEDLKMVLAPMATAGNSICWSFSSHA